MWVQSALWVAEGDLKRGIRYKIGLGGGCERVEVVVVVEMVVDGRRVGEGIRGGDRLRTVERSGGGRRVKEDAGAPRLKEDGGLALSTQRHPSSLRVRICE